MQTTLSSCLERLGPGDIAGSADLPVGGHKKGIAELMSVSKTPADANVSPLTASAEETGIPEVTVQLCLVKSLGLPLTVCTQELTLADALDQDVAGKASPVSKADALPPSLAAENSYGPDDMTCAICLEQIQLENTAYVVGCEHVYCGELSFSCLHITCSVPAVAKACCTICNICNMSHKYLLMVVTEF